MAKSVIATDKHFREWEREAFGYGYGTGEYYILPILHHFFLTLEDGHAYEAENVARELGNAEAWFLLNVLCHMNIVDYGTSPRYGWLTPMGERLRDYVLCRTPEMLYSIVMADGYNHGVFDVSEECSLDFCNCPDGVAGQGCLNNPLFNETVPDVAVS
jgi:hypothetical protein